MKKLIIYIVFAALLPAMPGCTKFLENESPSTMPGSKIFATEGDTYRAVLSIYATMASNRLYGYYLSMYAPYNNDIEYAKTSRSPEDNRRGIWDYTLTSSNTETLDLWTYAYSAINSANLCISGIENGSLLSAAPEAQPSNIRQLYGEAKALRALMYLEVVRLWGDVPFLKRETQYDDDFYVAPANRDDILGFLIDDLVSAEPGMLYANEMQGGSERLNRGAAQALIARMALTRGGWSLRPVEGSPDAAGYMHRPNDYMDYYQIANTYSKKLYESGKHSLGQSFRQVFVNQAQKVVTSTDDMLFEVASVMGYSSYVGHYLGHRIDNNSNIIYGYSNSWFMVTMPYFHSFDGEDVRRGVTCAPYSWEWNNDKGRIEQKIRDWKNIHIGKWSKLDMKTPQGAGATINTGINFPVLRYADALLMLAETENELNGGPTELAREALKIVRRRAFPTTQHSDKVDTYVASLAGHDAFFEAIVNERAWEFGGEAIRKYDLVRWNKLRQSLIDMRQKMIDMAIGARNGTGVYGNTPANIYWKMQDNGILDIVGLNNRMTSPPNSEYKTQAWARDMVSDAGGGNFIINEDVDYWWRPSVYQPDPMVYIFPYPKDVVAESKGKIVNHYGKR